MGAQRDVSEAQSKTSGIEGDRLFVKGLRETPFNVDAHERLRMIHSPSLAFIRRRAISMQSACNQQRATISHLHKETLGDRLRVALHGAEGHAGEDVEVVHLQPARIQHAISMQSAEGRTWPREDEDGSGQGRLGGEDGSGQGRLGGRARAQM